jgi:hypothetical protein
MCVLIKAVTGLLQIIQRQTLKSKKHQIQTVAGLFQQAPGKMGHSFISFMDGKDYEHDSTCGVSVSHSNEEQ